MHSPHTHFSAAGFVLVPVLLVLALLMGLAVALHTSVTMDSGLNAGFNRATAGFYAAESGLNVAMDKFRNMFLMQKVPSSGDFTQKSYTLGLRTVNYKLNDPGGNPHLWPVPIGQLFGGLNSIQYTYMVNSQAVKDGRAEADVGAQFNVNNIPIFQFIAFYTKDLEINPGAAMTLTGRIHTNGSLYLGPDSTLAIQPNASNPVVQVTARDYIYRGRKNTSSCGNTVTVTTTGGSPTAKTLACIGSNTTNIVPASTLATWGGSLVSNIKSITVPEPGITGRPGGTACELCEFWNNANLRIALDVTGSNNPTPTPPRIYVLDVDGNIDATKTAALAGMNSAPINWPLTRTVYYTDVPVAANGCRTPAANTNKEPNCYPGRTNTPTLTPTRTQTPATGTPTRTATRTPTPLQSATPTPTSEDQESTFSSADRVYGTNQTAPTPANDPVSMYRDTKWRRGGFYNWREKKWMYLLNVNLRDLLQWNTSNGNQLMNMADFPDNGGYVLYLTVIGDDAGAAANNYGVRIFGSSTLPFPVPADGDPTGITVVSDQALYIAGNYNSTGTKQPAALMGDSINVLSQNALVNGTVGVGCTNDCQSALALASRPAATTTVRAAFLGGVDTTISGGAYNGGLENYPRFHETWSGITFSYTGSFVSLGTPNHVNGIWAGTGSGFNIYDPPTRSYVYDSDFNDMKNLPPRTPRFVYVQQVVFTENFQ